MKFDRHEARTRLAELLREPMARVAEETRLQWLGRYDVEVARELLQAFGVTISDEHIRSFERVRDVLDAAANRRAALAADRVPRPAGAVTGRTVDAEPAPIEALLTEAAPLPPAPEGTYVSSSPYVPERIGAAALCCSDGRMRLAGDRVRFEPVPLA